MRNIIIGAIWIIIGIALTASGVSTYWEYSTSGIMWLFVILEIIQIKKIALGIVSISIGIALTKNKDLTERLISFSIWVLIIELGTILFDLIKYQSFHLWQFSLSSLGILVLIFISIKNCTGIKSKNEFISILTGQLKSDIVTGSILYFVILIVSTVIDYGFIESIRN